MITYLLVLVKAITLQVVFSSSSISSDPKIIGGSAISISRVPWQVSIRLKKYENKFFGLGHICGGSVISQRAVLTAAHCLFNLEEDHAVKRTAKDLKIVMGSEYLLQKTENTLIYNVFELIVHENFSLDTLMNDIALIFLNGQITLDYRTVRPISINSQPLNDGQICTVSGWGKMGNGRISNVLMAVSIPIVSKRTCTKSYGRLGIGMFCAGIDGIADSCQGDSGGGLQCASVLAGIVSWGFECGKVGYPGVYTNVSEYHDWIVRKNLTFNYTRYSSGVEIMPKYFRLFVLCTIFVIISWI